ncbi:hypothetical protein EDB84DRAFT_1442194 [Lactarius hengduanensis]|nr:hypothetical protein EDB84DRAFT_1442194 [Lactarius hengduanensis]
MKFAVEISLLHRSRCTHNAIAAPHAQAGRQGWTMDDLPSDFLFELEAATEVAIQPKVTTAVTAWMSRLLHRGGRIHLAPSHGRDDAHTLHGSLPDSTLGRVYRIYNRRQLHTLACPHACLSVLGVKPPVSPLFLLLRPRRSDSGHPSPFSVGPVVRTQNAAVVCRQVPVIARSRVSLQYPYRTIGLLRLRLRVGLANRVSDISHCSHFDCESGAAAEPRNYCGAKTGWTQHDAPGAPPPRLSDLTVSIQTGVLAKSRTPGGKRGVLRSRPRIETGDLLYALRELLWARHYFFSRQDENCHTLAKRRGQEMVLSQRQTVQEERDVVMNHDEEHGDGNSTKEWLRMEKRAGNRD